MDQNSLIDHVHTSSTIELYRVLPSWTQREFNFDTYHSLPDHVKMFSTHAAAEKAAMNGEGQEEYDTQFCQYLQEEIMSVGNPPRHYKDYLHTPLTPG